MPYFKYTTSYKKSWKEKKKRKCSQKLSLNRDKEITRHLEMLNASKTMKEGFSKNYEIKERWRNI